MEVGLVEPTQGQTNRHMVFGKIEMIVKEMQHPERGISVRSQKQFLTSVPSAFTGYDLVEWMMSNLKIPDSVEALSLANILCLYGYFFPVENKLLQVKDDNSLYRFQTPYFWISQNTAPDDTDYAVYLVKSAQRAKNAKKDIVLEDYEMEMLEKLKHKLRHKWEFVTVQADEQTKLAKDRKKSDKQILDSQEKAFWRVHRPPPGEIKCLESGIPRNYKSSFLKRRKNKEELKKEILLLKEMVRRTKSKMSQAAETLVVRGEQYAEHDPMVTSVLPSNPWITEDTTLWLLETHGVEMPTEQRVKKWSITFEELLSDEAGVSHFREYLKTEYSEENLLFWLAVEELRKCKMSQVEEKATQLYQTYLSTAATNQCNVDSSSLKKTEDKLKNMAGAILRFTFDIAQEHIYLLMKKDSYQRFLRSEHYRNLLESALQPQKQKKFGFGFGRRSKLTNPSPVGKRRGSGGSDKGSDQEAAPGNRGITPNSQHISLSTSNLRDMEDDGGLYLGEASQSGSSGSRLDIMHHSQSDPNQQLPRRVSLDVPRPVQQQHDRASSTEGIDTVGKAHRSSNGDVDADISIKVPQRTPTPNEVCPWEDDI